MPSLRLLAGRDCTPLYPSRWPTIGEEWQLARQTLAMSREAPYHVPDLEVPKVGIGQCAGQLAEVKVRYIPVFKSSSMSLCSQASLMRATSNAKREFTFTFVRDPISHFIAAYGEIANRALTFNNYIYNGSCKACYTFVDQFNSPSAAARAFLRDMLNGCLPSPCCLASSQEWYGADVHILPQVAFISHQKNKGASPLGFIGKMENLLSEWESIRDIVPGWPPFNSSLKFMQGASFCDTHMKTCESPGLVHRRAMQDLLTRDRQALLAVCRMMLMDFGCLDTLYHLPNGCQEIDPDEVSRSCPPALKSFMKGGLAGAWAKLERPGGARLAEVTAPLPPAAKSQSKVLFLTRGVLKTWLDKEGKVKVAPRIAESSRRAAVALNRKLEEGLLARTFECYGQVNASTRLNPKSFFENCALKELTQNAAKSWEANGKAVERFKPAVVLHRSTPRTAYPNSLVRWDWDHGSFAKSLCFGMIFTIPPLSMRGPFWPHDAWVSSEASWRAKRIPCKDPADPPSHYTSRRMEFFQSKDKARAFYTRCSDAAKEGLNVPSSRLCVPMGRFCQQSIHDHARRRNLTCWFRDWNAGLQRQSNYWQAEYASNKPRKPFARTQGCERGSLWNQAMFLKEHVRPVNSLAIFYANISGSGDLSRKSNSSELMRTAEYSFRVALHIHQLYKRQRGVTIPIVQLIADGEIAGSKAFESV
ncbi:MAG: hypothetical protein SGPRY_009135 [Prymnesium sp.]